jgi:hypothetical protein
MFGASVPEITNDLRYFLEYAGRRTRDFRVTVYEHPRLERADAQLAYPSYTGLAPKRIEDARRLSAVEGTRLDLGLQLNKPVKSARLVPKDQRQPPIPLRVETNRAAAALDGFSLAASQTWQLRLVDADGRTNKVPAQFIIEVLSNRPPELKLASPRGDVRPSPLEEIAFAGSVWDDFGVKAYGLAYTMAGQETRWIELGRDVPARQKQPYQHLLRLEELAPHPDQLISWFAWADDAGPDGQTRRTTSDLFFAEVRPFEEIFREGQSMDNASQPREQNEESDSPAGQTARLAEIQKQIISATWKLQREAGIAAAPSAPAAASNPPSPKPSAQYEKDATVVRDAQSHALEQARATAQRAQDPRAAILWTGVTGEMEKALTQLEAAVRSPAPLPQALTAEQAAYQALLRLQQHQYDVARNRSHNNRGQSNSRQQAMDRQLDQLDLAQAENRYETQRQAQAPPTPQRREQLQVLNRLQELARRQQDLNERLRELQTALQEARSEPEREEARRRLKRLQEEERQMLADVDELRQRMERPENQSQMSDQRRQLEQTRQDLQRAADAAGREAASQALAAGTRAQRDMQQMRDDLRKENAGEFAEDLRRMRAEARELERRQEEIRQQLNSLAANSRRTLSDSAERQRALDQLADQKKRLTNIVQQATQVAQQAESAEPLVARGLEETVRQFTQEDASSARALQEELLRRGLLTRGLNDRLEQVAERQEAQALELTAEMLRQGYVPQAGQAEERARGEIGRLTRGVERAAERVVGDDTESLRRARQELEQLTAQVEREIANAQAPAAGAPPSGASNTNRPAAGDPQSQPRSGDRPQTPAPGAANAPARQANTAAPTPDSPRGAAASDARRPATAQPNGPGGRGGRLLDSLDAALNDQTFTGTGPITGEDFTPWSDRLREIEELVELPSLRGEIATARERARQMRQEFKRNLKKPDWAVVRLQVLRPLVEVRNELELELARRGPKDALVPLDRDPVPSRFSELVRRYYEDLGKEQR